MNKNRITKLEQTIHNRKTRIELPLFLSVDEERDEIIFTDRLLIQLGVNPEDYEEHKEDDLSLSPTGRKVPKNAPFIARYTGEDWAPDCYLYLKGFEEQRIILL